MCWFEGVFGEFFEYPDNFNIILDSGEMCEVKMQYSLEICFTNRSKFIKNSWNFQVIVGYSMNVWWFSPLYDPIAVEQWLTALNFSNIFFFFFSYCSSPAKIHVKRAKKNTSRFSSHVFIAHVFLINSSKSREKNRSRFSKDANIPPINYFYRIPKAIHVIHNVRMVKMNEIHSKDVSHVWSAFETVEQ